MIVGAHYDYYRYNCAHFVADWYNQKLGITIPTDNCFELSFARWLRKHFVQIDKPQDHCIVHMQDVKLSHVGVYSDYGVYHNWKPTNGKGSVVHSTLTRIRKSYAKVTYWKWSESFITQTQQKNRLSTQNI